MKRFLITAISAVTIVVAPGAAPASAATTVHMTAVQTCRVHMTQVHMT